ncbi:MAG TPA: stress response translation initiation inhibitor YciH [Ktedonobacterales bacterium]
MGSGVLSAPRDGYVRIARDRKSRGGKTVTILAGIPGDAAEVTQLAQSLKKLCGSGGTVKGDSIEIQGDHRDRLESRLKELGYKVKRVGG